MCFRGVGLGDGVGETFLCLGDAVGDGLGVALFVARLRCLRGAGVGVGSKILLIFAPNDSSAVPGVMIAPKQIVASRRTRKNHFSRAKQLTGELLKNCFVEANSALEIFERKILVRRMRATIRQR